MAIDSVNRCLLFCLLPFLLLDGVCGDSKVEFSAGVDVTLQCSYDAKYYGRLGVCWGRGTIPNSGCANEVIRSDGTTVTSRLSERYLLMGDLASGDVSLTIRQAQVDDSGLYGCRVDIPGWFNDHKHQLTLSVVPSPPRTVRAEVREVRERTIGVQWTPGFDGGSPITGYRIDLKSKQASWDTEVTTAEIHPPQTEATLIDLRPGKTYSLRMFAINSVGMSEASNVLTVTTKESAPEGPPLDMKVLAITSRTIKVTWRPPKVELRNGVLRSYVISYREFDEVSSEYKKWHHLTVTARKEVETVTLNHLRPSTKYGIIIQAKSNAGLGPATSTVLSSTLEEVLTTSTAETTIAATVWGQSTTSFTAVAPDPPFVEVVEVSDNAITLHWTPGFDGGSPIISYDLEYKGVNASWDLTKRVEDFSSVWTMATIIETQYSTCNIRMFARNGVGISEASNVLTVTVGVLEHTTATVPLGKSTTQGFPEENISTTMSSDSQAATGVQDGQGGHLAAIVVPVLLVLIVAAVIVTWQLRRMKLKEGGFTLTWLPNHPLRFRNSEPIPEL